MTAEILRREGACGAGVCLFDDLRQYLNERMSARLGSLPFEPVTVIVGSFPYFSGECKGNIAHFARAPDYHEAVYRRIAAAALKMADELPDKRFFPLKNGWPLPIVAAARLAGVARTGRHGLAIDDVYGSYIAISAVICDSPLPLSAPLGDCEGCKDGCACIAACPTGATVWDGKRRVLDRQRCISHITQAKNTENLDLLTLSPYVWGCDICQAACAKNRCVPVSPLPEFNTKIITNVSRAVLRVPGALDDRHYARKTELIARNIGVLHNER